MSDEVPDQDEAQRAIELFAPDQSGLVEDEDEKDPIPEEYRKKTKAEILAELEQAKQQADLTRSISEGLASVGKEPERPSVVTPQPQPPAPQPPPKLDINNDNFFDDTMGNLDKYFQYKMGPYLQEVAERDLRKDARLLQLDPESGEFARKHWQEIEAVVHSMPAQERYAGNAYDRALQKVQAGHPDEMAEAALQRQLKSDPSAVIKALESIGYQVAEAGRNGQPQRQPGTSYAAGDSGVAPQTRSAKRRYRVSVEDDRQARNRGVPLADYVAWKSGIPKDQLELVTR